ncbi:MAG: M14 family zinc carboxypeptidase [Chthoniobacterales bacterium]
MEGRDIVARTNFDPALSPPLNVTMLIGGQHGDEPATVDLIESFEMPRSPVVILSRANPDGLAARSRYNARGVDPNRNCDREWSADSEEPPGSAPWSEPESRAIRDAILKFLPAKIVSLHWALAEVDADGAQSTSLAVAMWEAMTETQRSVYRLRLTENGDVEPGLQIREDACPGSLGQWCGFGLRYPDGSSPAMVTLELPYDPFLARPAVLPEDHVKTVQESWEREPGKYLSGVRPAVHAMLRAACGHTGR